MNTIDAILLSKLQTLLGERGPESNRAVRYGELFSGLEAFATLPGGGVARLARGSDVSPALAFKDAPATGFFLDTDDLVFVVDGVERFRITSSGVIASLISGTAVTQTNVDTTSGRLLKVGDYGIGAGSSVDVTDWNDATINGAIYDGNGAANAPAASGYFLGTYHRLTSLYGIQQVIGLSGAMTDHIFSRRLDAGVWQPWFEVYSTANPPPGGGGGAFSPVQGWAF